MSGDKSKKIVKNTILLYLRMAIVMVVNLYLVRLVLNLLGVQDYGIYNVVAGVITMLSSVTVVLSTSVQRFYSYTIGEHNDKGVEQIFSCGIIIYIIFSLVVLLVGETIGLWFINHELDIPRERIIAANWVYQFSILTFIVSIMQTPFSALCIAYEDMNIYAIITIMGSILKVILVFCMKFIPYDKLILYSASLLLITLLDCLAYIIFAKKKYKNCKFLKIRNLNLYKKILSFSGWTFLGSIAGVGMNQINTILTNIFFGVIVNAARAISLQIFTAMNTFTNSIIMAIRPPMIKSYAEGDYAYVLTLFNISNKVIMCLLSVVSIPLIIEMEGILHFWLGINDYQTVLFSRLMVICSFILALHNPITIIMQASGKIKKYYIQVESLTLLCVPFTYILFKLGYPASSTYVIMIMLVILSHFVRLYSLKKELPIFSIRYYLIKFILPASIVYFIAYIVCYIISDNMNYGVYRFLCVSIVSVLMIVVNAYFIAFSKSERISLKRFVLKKW